MSKSRCQCGCRMLADYGLWTVSEPLTYGGDNSGCLKLGSELLLVCCGLSKGGRPYSNYAAVPWVQFESRKHLSQL